MFARVYLFAIFAALGSIGKAFQIPECAHVSLLVRITGTMNVLAQACQTTYTVQVGDTCLTIAQKFGITVPALIAVNPVSSLHTLIHLH